jgi:hypothetical protein
MGDDLTVEVIRQLPLATVAIIACVALWRAYKAATEAHIKDLRESYAEQIGELRARLMVIEDALHIPRADRAKYLPTIEMPKKSEMKDLD